MEWSSIYLKFPAFAWRLPRDAFGLDAKTTTLERLSRLRELKLQVRLKEGSKFLFDVLRYFANKNNSRKDHMKIEKFGIDVTDRDEVDSFVAFVETCPLFGFPFKSTIFISRPNECDFSTG
jgi:hypothetical protein